VFGVSMYNGGKAKLQNGCLNRIIPEKKIIYFLSCLLRKQADMLHLGFVRIFTCLLQFYESFPNQTSRPNRYG